MAHKKTVKKEMRRKEKGSLKIALIFSKFRNLRKIGLNVSYRNVTFFINMSV